METPQAATSEPTEPVEAPGLAELTGRVVETALALVRRGGVGAVLAAVAVAVGWSSAIVAMSLLGLAIGAAPIASVFAMSAILAGLALPVLVYSAALVAFTHALDRVPSLGAVLRAVFTRPTLEVLGVPIIVIAFAILLLPFSFFASGGPGDPVAGLIVFGLFAVPCVAFALLLVAQTLVTAAAGYANPDDPHAWSRASTMLEGHSVLALGTVSLPLAVAGALIGGAWSPLVHVDPTLLVATSVAGGALVAILLAVLPAALYGVLRSSAR
jgi:hypothetical protein